MRETAILFLLVLFVSSAAAINTGPEIQEVRVYDVSDLQQPDWRTGGELLDSGLNTTLTADHKDQQKLFRVTFEVRNTGTDPWQLENSDVLYHDGLNQTWQVEEILYNTTQTYTGGDVLDGRLDWDTSSGGTVGTFPENDTLHAKYIFNATHNRTISHFQHFKASDASEANSTEDYHTMRLLKYGMINAEIQDPPNNTVVTQNEYFNINTSYRCVSGSCGDITSTARYNSSGMTPIPESSGTPFYAEANPRDCGSYIGFNETCQIDWKINATGELETVHKIDAQAESNLTGVDQEETENRTIEINSAVYIDLTWDTVDFGLLDPGTQEVPAEGNDQLRYNVTVGEYSEDPSGLWLKSTPLEGPLGYSIGPANLTYATENSYSASKPLSENYQILESSPQPGGIYQSFYWLNTPSGIYHGDYSGTLTVKANASTQ